MTKCVFCKKYTIDGLYRCEITGQIFKRECLGYTPAQLKCNGWRNYCSDFTASLYDRFWAWVDLH